MADEIFASLANGLSFRRTNKASKASRAPNAAADLGSALQPAEKQRVEEDEPDIALFGGAQAGRGRRPHSTAAPVEAPPVRSNDPHEAVNVLRKLLGVKVVGPGLPPPPLQHFAEVREKYSCGSQLYANLEALGFPGPSPIQAQAIPALLRGRELLAVAPTGSGKTLAFMLPIIMAIQAQKYAEGRTVPQLGLAAEGATQAAGSRAGRAKAAQSDGKADADAGAGSGVRALVLSPTAELAAQSARVLKLLLPGTGVRAALLTNSTAAGTDFTKVDILLATPVRLELLLAGGALQLGAVRHLVFDEADKLFDLQLALHVDSVIAACSHTDVVRALFSATLPEAVEELARSVLTQPLRVMVGVRGAAACSVRQRLLFVGNEAGKLMALRDQLKGGQLPLPALVFVSSKERAQQLLRELKYEGLHMDAIDAEQSQAARAAAVESFRSGRTWVLITTDLLGRGMDFAVRSVINYDFPSSTADYVHRVGRTGRAGRTGEALTLYTEENAENLRSIANVIRASGGDVPGWMLELKNTRSRDEWKAPPGKIGAAGDQSRDAKRQKMLEHKKKGLSRKTA